jgi:superoxide dismutase, Cu-Zn family
MAHKFQWLLAGVIGAGLMGACSTNAADKPAAAEKADKAAAAKSAKAHIHGAGENKGKIHGSLTFAEVDGGVKVTGEISGLTPGKHGFHIHEKGELTDDKLTSAGGHFNPGKHKHGGPDTAEKHAGDLGNITADEKGVAKVDATFKGVSLSGKEDGIIGRSVIVHAKEDDMKTDPSGNSGDRIAGGKIETGGAEKK